MPPFILQTVQGGDSMDFENDNAHFVFPVNRDISLINDFMLRREVFDRMPIPLGLIMDGEWVWVNRSMRDVVHRGDPSWIQLMRHIAVEAEDHVDTYRRQLASGPRSVVNLELVPVFNVEGALVAYMAWGGDARGAIAAEQLETAILMARDREVVWVNPSAEKAFDIEVDDSWDNIAGFPNWDEVVSGVTTRHVGDYLVRYMSVGIYVVVEAWCPEISDDRAAIPMEEVARLVHEIRNPLAALSGYVEMAQLEAGIETQNFYYEMMQEIDRLSRLTTDFLAVARPLIVHPDWVSLDSLVEHAWFASERGIVGAEQKIRLNKGYPSDQMLWGDGDRLQQVMTNLIKNAVEAMQDHGGTIEISYRETLTEILVEVKDNGPGIDQELIRQIFVSRVTTKDSGNGFGLLIVRRIMEAHGGSIRVVSDAGTRIELVFPKENSPL